MALPNWLKWISLSPPNHSQGAMCPLSFSFLSFPLSSSLTHGSLSFFLFFSFFLLFSSSFFVLPSFARAQSERRERERCWDREWDWEIERDERERERERNWETERLERRDREDPRERPGEARGNDCWWVATGELRWGKDDFQLVGCVFPVKPLEP